MRSNIYNSKSGGMGPRRSQQRTIIPAWRKGDWVTHKPSGLSGQLVCMETAGGEMWKLRPAHARTDNLVIKGGDCLLVHACDLEMQP